jgi:hypothetical protein
MPEDEPEAFLIERGESNVRSVTPGRNQPGGERLLDFSSSLRRCQVGPCRIAVMVLFILLHDSSWSPITVCRTVWTRQHDFVTIEITKPDFPMVWASPSIGWVSVAGRDDFSAHHLGPCNCRVDVANLKPKKQSVSRRHVVRIADGAVMMFYFPRMQLHH